MPEGATSRGRAAWPAGRPVAVTLSVVTVLALLAGVAGLVLPKMAEASQSDQADARQHVLARASDFVTAYNTYSSRKIGDYQDRVGGLLTDDFDKEFEKASSAYLGALRKKRQTSRDATVLGAAVDSIDDDSAEVIVAVDATIENTDSSKPIPRHFRWRVSLERVDGSWLVSKYTPVATNIRRGSGTPQSGSAPQGSAKGSTDDGASSSSPSRTGQRPGTSGVSGASGKEDQ